MRKSNLIPKFISVMLTLSLLFSMVPLSVSATTENDSNTSVSNEMSVSGVNSLGNMIAKTLGEQHTEVAENNGNSIYSITVEENIATASFQTDIDATLVVAVYNEAADALIASGTVEVSSDDNEAEVEIEIDTMPQYFYLKGFLIDSENYKPICTAYESPNYTEEMQEFFAKTTEDFAQDSLLNLDDDITNNFAVYKDSVIMLATDESGTNTLSYDLSTDTYTIENADEIALAMQAGDIFVYNHESVDAVIVKIAEITTDGTTATITGADTVVEEVFEYVRIEATGEKGNYTEDSSTLDPDLTPYPNTYRLRRGVDVTASETISEKYEVSSELGDNCKITGTLTFGLTASAKVYVSPSYSYAEVKFDYSIGATLTFEGEASKDYKLKGYNLPLAYGAIIISITPTVKFESSVNITCSGTLSGTVGACVDTDSGYRSLNKDPEFKPEFKAEGKIYIGIALEAKVSVLAVVAQASVTGELGVEVEGKLCGAVTFDDNEAHDCKACIDGDINAKISVTLSIGLLELESLTYTKPFEYTTKIADFYYSLTYNEFAFTPCPHLRYKVTVVVNDKNNFPVESALVNSNYYTDSNGVATLKLPNGTYNISASHNDLTASQQVTVKDSATTVILTLGGSSGSGSGENIPGGGFVSNGDVVSIATGSSHSAAVTKDGTLYMWGANNNHCLGDNVTTTAHSPIKVSGSNSLIPENSVKSVSLGYQHTAVILTDGSLYTWGYNNCGQLGNGNTGSTYLPQKIMENVKSVSLSYSHSAAITTDGSLYMWGSNDNGQLGNGTTNNSSSPIKIMDNVKSVSLGYAHSAAVTEDGVLYVWGFGTHGQIGNNTYSDNYRAHTELSPVKIMENVASVSLGNHHSAAITTDGNLYVWGHNYYGQIGDGTTTRRTYPVKIANNIAKVSLGEETTFAFTNDGALYGWGYNNYGQLGNGKTINVSVPQKIMSNAVMAAPSLSGSHTAILTSGGDVYTCGHNAQGQLGNGTTTNSIVLNQIEICDHTPSLTDAGISYNIDMSDLNYNFASNGDVVSVATGDTHSAAVTKDGTLYMWGANYNHCLGDNVTTTAHSPIKVSGSNSLIPENSVKSVSLGYQHTAVILTDGSLYTWGYNNCGQLGNGNTGSTYLPQKIMENVKSVSLSYSHSAAITTDGSLYMWGSNDNGQLGNGTTNNSSSPIKIMDNVKSVSLGYAHSAAVTEDGVLYVWGFGTHGQIGNNTYSDNYRAHTELSPVKIMENVASVSLGNHHSAAITTDGNLYVWGHNYYGQIGDGTTTRRTYPVKIANNIAKVSLGRETTFAFTNDGALYGWGYNYHGQLGNGTTTNVSVPQKIMSDVVMAAPSVLGAYTAILTSGGDVYTCGHNAQGQLGTGTTDNCYTLTKIDIYDHTPYLTAADNNPTSTYGLLRATAVPKRTATFNGLMANATYNFYSIKTKKAENVMSSENLLYVDQVTADQNGSITISYYPDEAYSTPFEFVANLTRIHMQNTEITVPEYYYNGTEQRFNPVIKFGEYTLTEGIDYEFEGISKATASGEYVVNICGKGNFVGKISTSFVINKVSVANLKVEGLGEIQYSGNALTPEITVTDGNRTLIKDTDYTVEYQNNTNLGIGIAVVKGIDNYTDRQICWFDIVECELTAEMIKLNTKQLYTGQAVTPEITVSNGENTLIKDIDYTVEFKNNVEIGTARAVITGMGNYTGSVEMEFEICEGVYGDADRDCDVNVNDVTAIQLHLAQLKEFSELELKYCDVDGDGAVTITDATYVQLYLAGYIENFSVM